MVHLAPAPVPQSLQLAAQPIEIENIRNHTKKLR